MTVGWFFSKGARGLRRLPEGLRRAVLLGCMGGIGAQMIDAMANGSWRYPECSIFFWLVLGLGTAVIRMAYQSPPFPLHSARDESIPMGPPANGAGRPLAPPPPDLPPPARRGRPPPALRTGA